MTVLFDWLGNAAAIGTACLLFVGVIAEIQHRRATRRAAMLARINRVTRR